jgi:mannan endo-1,4-beta-mannosidase
MKTISRRDFLRTTGLALPALTGGCTTAWRQRSLPAGFVEIRNGRLQRGGNPYYFIGANCPGAITLGNPAVPGGRARLRQELDALHSLGITNLRLLAASEGSGSRATTIAPGQWNECQLQGLDFVLAEMARRRMCGVLYLTNYREWSGGLAQYVSWATGEPLPKPEDWMRYAARFYRLPAAQELYRASITHLLKRRNTVNGMPYSSDPAIMAWQVCNEPRPGPDEPASEPVVPHYVEWLDRTARLIKELSPRHLVSTGSEGRIGSLGSAAIYLDAHRSAAIDYLTLHVWVKNWKWLTEPRLGPQYESTVARATDHVREHVEFADRLGRPLVMEEFGIPRDNEALSISGSTRMRDDYFRRMFAQITLAQRTGGALQGANFWAWEEAPVIGPSARLDLNAVLACDRGTARVIADNARQLL